nr:PTS sugar transporter subunit IIA [Pectinatus sottacetonis]
MLVSHGSLCKYILKSAAMITGNIEQTCTVTLEFGESLQNYETRIREAVDMIDSGDGIIALVDVLGGTPYNVVGSVSRDYNIQIITGMNMPMLVHIALERSNGCNITNLVNTAYEAGQKGIQILRK